MGEEYSCLRRNNLKKNEEENGDRERTVRMDPQITEVSQVFERFKAAYIRKDFDTCDRLLSQLKVTSFFPRSASI